jgi:hypothetical protein
MPISVLENLRNRIDAACDRAGRQNSSVGLVGASKTVAPPRLEAFFDAGLNDFGENYIQEGVLKVRHFRERGLEAQWHFIGALQSNKAREATENFSLIHSVDRLSLAREIDKAARKIGKIQRVLVQVNLENEPSKAGVSPDEASQFLDVISNLENLQIQGLMSLPPFLPELEAMRRFHRELRELRDSLASPEMPLVELSMGMSHDFEVAIEEGATLIRVGTALFGARR